MLQQIDEKYDYEDIVTSEDPEEDEKDDDDDTEEAERDNDFNDLWDSSVFPEEGE
tara:strand:+ start:574 stop:738 length:165 start_codon:yes stop_codon:yes gene_type:complete